MKKSIVLIIAFLLAVSFAVPAFAKEKAIIMNGDFEEGAGGTGLPTPWEFHSYEAEYMENVTNAFAVIENDPERGGVLHISAAEDDDAAVFQAVKVEPSAIYRMTCSIRTEGVENGAGANIALREIIAVSNGVFGDSGWTEVELVGKTGPGQTQMIVSCRVGGYSAVGHGDAWFDDFRIEKIDSYSGEIVPFYAGTIDEDESGAGGSYAGLIITILIFAAVAAGIASFVVIRSVMKKKKEGEAKPLPSPQSYAQDKVRGLAEQPERGMFDLGGDMPGPTDTKLRFTKLDRIFVLVLTGVYAVIALLRLGTLSFPTSRWEADKGESVRIEFGRSVKLSEIWQNSGISHVKYKLVTDDGSEIQIPERDGREYGHMYRWTSIDPSSVSKLAETTGVTLSVWGGDSSRPNQADLIMLEMAFFDENGELVECTVPDSAKALFDEQGTVPEITSYYNGMYFDELYHGRTALEHIENLPVYEWTHPPLGKLLISVGILIFGMKPFGWRIIGVLFGIAMLPILYALAKRILKKSELALFTTFLFAFDFMHFTQTRIATVDVFGVFFILLMTYYMYVFISMDIGDSIKSMLRPLALSGVFFGLGCASKWICLYTGVGLALMFFTKLVLMGIRSAKLAKEKKYRSMELVKKFFVRAGVLCAWCVVFFIIVPALIYAASYVRYYTAQWLPNRQAQIYNADPSAYASASEVKLGFGDAVSTYVKGVIKNQKDMFNYHSQLKSEHSASSTWWMWLADLRPTWFYVGGSHTETLANGGTVNYVGTISAFGNPFVWVLCTIATIALIVMMVIRKKKFTTGVWFTLVCFGSSFMPWVFITRSTYAYHFFASVPFIALASGQLLGCLEGLAEKKREDAKKQKKEKNEKAGRSFIFKVKYVWMAAVLIAFGLFFPVISGVEAPREYIAALQWVPFHKYEIVNEEDEVVKTYRIGWTFTSYEPGNVNKKDKNGNYIYITRIKQ